MKSKIIKSLTIVLVISLVMVLGSGCTKKSEVDVEETTAEATTVEATLDEPEAIRIAHAFFDAYITADYETAYAQPFDKAMKAAFPESVMKSVADQIQKSYGDFLEEKGEKTGYSQGYFIVTIGGIHEKKALAYNIVINTSLEISGFNYNEISDINTFFEVKQDVGNAVEVTFGDADWPLTGILLYPEGDGDFPVVVLVHGSGPNDRDETLYGNKPFKDIAEGLVKKGIAVLRYDKRTYTHSSRYTDPEVANNVTIYEEVIDDAGYAIDFLKTQKQIDLKQIYVLGHSLGGNQAPRIADGRTDVAGIVIMGGNVTPIQDLMLYQYEYLFSIEKDLDDATKKRYEEQIEAVKEAVEVINSESLTLETDPTTTLGIPAKYWMDLRDYDPTAIAEKLGIPILVLQGGRDYQVPATEFEKWQTRLLGKADYRLYDTLNHLFMAGEGTPGPNEYMVQGNVSQEMIDDIAKWIDGNR